MSEYAVTVLIMEPGWFDITWLFIALESNAMQPQNPAEAEQWRLFYAQPRDAVLEALYDASSVKRTQTAVDTVLSFVIPAKKLRQRGVSKTDVERVLELAVQYTGRSAEAIVREQDRYYHY